MKLRTHSSSAGSALTRVRWTTAPATTSKMRSAVRAASCGSVSGEFAAGLGACSALQDQAFLAVDDRLPDAVAQGVVVDGLGDHRHQAALGLRAGQDRRELEDNALDVGGQRAPVGEVELVEELRHRVDDEFVLARPAAVEGGFRNPARVATSPNVSLDQPSSTRASRVAARIAVSAVVLRGRPAARGAGVLLCIPRP